MGLVVVCLAIMGALMFLSVVSGNNFTGVSQTVDIDSSVLINGSSSEISFEGTTAFFSLNMVEGALIWFIVIVVVASLFGFRVVSTGLSETSVKTIRTCFMYGGVWGVLSVLTYDLIVSIQIFGGIIYVGLTMMYVIGVFQKMGGNG